MSIGWIIFFAAIVLIVVGVTIWDKLHPVKGKCVHCDSNQVVEIERRTLSSWPVQFMDGGQRGGGDVRVQRAVEVMYRCQACGKGFSHRTTQSS